MLATVSDSRRINLKRQPLRIVKHTPSHPFFMNFVSKCSVVSEYYKGFCCDQARFPTMCYSSTSHARMSDENHSCTSPAHRPGCTSKQCMYLIRSPIRAGYSEAVSGSLDSNSTLSCNMSRVRYGAVHESTSPSNPALGLRLMQSSVSIPAFGQTLTHRTNDSCFSRELSHGYGLSSLLLSSF